MTEKFNVISIALSIITFAIPVLHSIKRAEEKNIEKYHVKLLKRVALEFLIAIVVIFYLFSLPKIAFVRVEQYANALLILMALLMILYYKDSYWLNTIRKKKPNLKFLTPYTIKVINRLMLAISIFALVILLLSANNYIIESLEEDVRNLTSKNVSINSLRYFLTISNDKEIFKGFEQEIKTYKMYIFAIDIMYYIFLRTVYSPVINKIVKMLTVKYSAPRCQDTNFEKLS